MTRNHVQRLHAAAGALALTIIVAFLSATVVVEIGGSHAAIAAVKRAIAYGLLVLVPALAVTGMTGNRLAKGSRAPAVAVKRRRTAAAAANGVLVLVPCALALHWLAARGLFGPEFYAIQGLELVAGPVNAVLLALNARDGLRMSGRLAAARKPTRA